MWWIFFLSRSGKIVQKIKKIDNTSKKNHLLVLSYFILSCLILFDEIFMGFLWNMMFYNQIFSLKEIIVSIINIVLCFESTLGAIIVSNT